VAAWGPFLAVAVFTLGAVLVLARLSADTIDEYAPNSTAEQSPATVPEDPSGIVPRESTADSVDSAVRTPVSHAGEHGSNEAGREPELVLTPKLLMANVALTQGLVLVILVLAAWYFAIPARAFGVTADTTGVATVALGVGFGVVLWLANELSTTLADAVGAAYDERVRELLAPDSPGGWLTLFGVVLPIIALGEEILFRAALIGVPEAGFGVNAWVLAVASSLSFALGHGAQGRVGVVVTGGLGLVLAAGYVVTGSLLVVVVAHYVINALEFGVHELLDIDGLGR
jgi:membrane protease YdiL (CAAX protease family)